MFIPLWIAVWLNGFIMALVVPQLLHSIFGVDTLLSTIMGTYSLLRSSAFWLSLLAGAWLALDPIVKCTFVVVYQHLRSRREGDDLRGLLASLPRDQRRKAEMIASAGAASRAMLVSFALLATILLVGAQTARARGAQVPSSRSSAESAADSTQEARVHKLRQALERNHSARFIVGTTLSTPARQPGLRSSSQRSGTPSIAHGMRSKSFFVNFGSAG